MQHIIRPCHDSKYVERNLSHWHSRLIKFISKLFCIRIINAIMFLAFGKGSFNSAIQSKRTQLRGSKKASFQEKSCAEAYLLDHDRLYMLLKSSQHIIGIEKAVHNTQNFPILYYQKYPNFHFQSSTLSTHHKTSLLSCSTTLKSVTEQKMKLQTFTVPSLTLALKLHLRNGTTSAVYRVL